MPRVAPRPLTVHDYRLLLESGPRYHDIAVPSDKVLAEAAGRDLSAYDAEYIVAARQLGVPLVTCDTRLRNAVPDVAIRPEEFR